MITATNRKWQIQLLLSAAAILTGFLFLSGLNISPVPFIQRVIPDAVSLSVFHTSSNITSLLRIAEDSLVKMPHTYFQTARGKVSDLEIERELNGPMGYQYIQLSEPLATVRRKEPQSCDKIFEEWLAIAKKHDYKSTPPREINVDLKNKYTMNGFAYFEEWYLSERSTENALHWDASTIEKQVKAATATYGYGKTGGAVDYSTRYYNLSGLIGLVVGSLSPWVEVICLRNGAKKVMTVEYQKISSNHPQLGYAHPVEMAKNWRNFYESFDFVVSFSSIEHSGLGRYGDPIDPIGDLREMQKIRCQLKKGGLMFLGVPTGADIIVYNAHRLYGRLRLPLMFEGFEFLNAFYGTDSTPVKLTNEHFLGRSWAKQFVFVLRKL